MKMIRGDDVLAHRWTFGFNGSVKIDRRTLWPGIRNFWRCSGTKPLRPWG